MAETAQPATIHPMRLALLGKSADHVLAYRGSLVRAAQARGHEVHAITGAARDPRTRDRLRAAGVALHEIPLDGGGTNPWRDLRAQRAMRDAMRSMRADAAFCYNPKFVAYGPPAARAAGVPRVAAMVTGLGYAFTEPVGARAGTNAARHGRLKRGLVRFVVRRLYRRAVRRCDVVFFQNRDDLAEFRAGRIVDGATRTCLVPGSGVDLDHFAPRPVPDGVHFLMISRLLRDKGVVEYAQACAQVARTHPQAIFTLLGGSDNNPTAVPEGTLAAWRRAGVPTLIDPVDDVRPALAACTIFVLPSYREGTSKVMLEAMATGRAIVTTDAIGCREPIEPEANGLLVPVASVEPLAAAMRRLADDRALVVRMGAASRRIAEARFDARGVDATILAALGL